MNKCSGKCGRVLPHTTEFFHKRGGTENLHIECKDCRNEKRRVWRAENSEHIRKYGAKYRKENKEIISLQQAAYRTTDAYAESQQRYAESSKGKEARTRSWQIRRARKANAPVVESFNRKDVLDRWGTDCHICGEPVDLLDWHQEHVVALANKGHHSLANVKPSHPKCNLSKGTK